MRAQKKIRKKIVHILCGYFANRDKKNTEKNNKFTITLALWCRVIWIKFYWDDIISRNDCEKELIEETW